MPRRCALASYIVIRLYEARGWRTDLPRLVLLLQVGNAANFFGYGLIVPFEIIYLHQIPGFATATAGLVLAGFWAQAPSCHLPREPRSITFVPSRS
jgi:hypothetical protein